MKNALLAAGFFVLAVPAFAAGVPHLSPSAPAASAPPSLPLPPASVDLGLSTPGFGKTQLIAPKPTVLPGLAEIIPYYDNTGTGGRLNTDLEVDTNGQKNANPLIVYGLVFTDPPKHPLHLIADIAGIKIDRRIDQP